MRGNIFNGYNNEHPSLGTDFKTQSVLDGSIDTHLNPRAKPNVFKSNHSRVEKFQHPLPLNEHDPFRTNPNLDLSHTVPTGMFRKDKRTLYSSPDFPALKDDDMLMKPTNLFDDSYLIHTK
jgi:hypothetical protein